MTVAVRRKRRTWVLRVVAVLFPFGAVALVNAALYWADVGVDTAVVVTNDRVAQGEFFLNPHCDLAYCNRDLRGPEPRVFRRPKSGETFRVVVVGASSVQGYPYPSELAFPRHLELLLGRQFRDRTVEVLNAGVVGLSTTPLVDLVSHSVEASPDLIVLYAGHNEFYGVGGVATNARVSPLGIRVRRFRLGQVLTSYFSADEDSASGELITELPRDIAIPIDSPLMIEAEAQYKKNLTAIAGVCSRKQIPLVVCSVVSNLRDHSPLGSPLPPSLAQAERAKLDELEAEATRLMTGEQFADAVEPLRAAMRLVPNRAETSYRLAVCLDRSGQMAEADEYYARARDLDGCRYRAPSEFRGIATQVASERTSEGIHFVDLVPAFSQASEDGVPGHDLFLEHVHFTFEGHWLAATTIAKTIVEAVRRDPWNEELIPSAEERDAWLGVVPEDHIVATRLAAFLLERPPFNESFDVERQWQALMAKIDTHSEQLTEQELLVFASLAPGTKVDDLIDGLGRAHLSQGDVDRALVYFELGKQRRPWMPNSFVFAGICRHLLGQNDRVMENIEMSYHTPMPETEPLLVDRNEVLNRIGTAAGHLQ